MADAWLTPSDELLTELWPDAPSAETAVELLDAAQDQCAAYAPTLAPEAVIPARYKVALVMQARALHRSLVAGSGDQIVGDGFTVTVWPMDRTVKALLRPPRRSLPR